jgi:O-antigen/teichoic acid export membrane protein
MRQIVRKLQTSTFIRHNTIFFFGSLGMGFLNYLYYPVLGRLLHPDSFGEVQTLSSLFAQITIFLSVLGLLTVNIVANYDDEGKRNRLIAELERLAVLVGTALLFITILVSIPLQHFFHFASSLPFSVLTLAVLVSVPLTFRSAYLRGLKRFGLVSVIGIIGATADLILAAALVVMGFGTTGAILGLVLGQAIAFGFAIVQARRNGFSESLRSTLIRMPDLKLIKPELKYALLVLVCSLSITGMYSLDSIVVKHYFNAQTAGLYAGISTVARIIFFLTASVAQVLLPSIHLRGTARDNQRVLIKSLLLLVAVGGATLIVFAALPKLIIRILMGSKYLVYADLLPRLGLVLFIISVINLFIMYHMALRHYAIMFIGVFGICITAIFLRLQHQTLQAVIDSLLYGSLTMMACLALWVGSAKLKLMKST